MRALVISDEDLPLPCKVKPRYAKRNRRDAVDCCNMSVMNISVPVEIKKAVYATCKEGYSISSYVSELLAKALTVEKTKRGEGKHVMCRCGYVWKYFGRHTAYQQVSCPDCKVATRLAHLMGKYLEEHKQK